MAEKTDIALQKQVIYSIYVRAHTGEGSFLSLIPDLDRIRALGTDIIWLMPIHPIGVKNRKGSLGCPYANRDYRTVNPEYGTMEDFRTLTEEIHKRGMKCIIDVVYNHTSPDAVLLTVVDTAHLVIQRIVLRRIEIERADGILPSVFRGVGIQAEHRCQIAAQYVHLQRAQQIFQLMPKRDGHAYAPVSVCIATSVASCTPSMSSMRPTRSAF